MTKLKSIDKQSEEMVSAICGIYKKQGVVNALDLAGALGGAAAALFMTFDNGGPLSTACRELCQDIMNRLMAPEQPAAQVIPMRRFPASVFPPCSSCGQDHHPSMECADEAKES